MHFTRRSSRRQRRRRHSLQRPLHRDRPLGSSSSRPERNRSGQSHLHILQDHGLPLLGAWQQTLQEKKRRAANSTMQAVVKGAGWLFKGAQTHEASTMLLGRTFVPVHLFFSVTFHIYFYFVFVRNNFIDS